jgi:hypothetical protein
MIYVMTHIYMYVSVRVCIRVMTVMSEVNVSPHWQDALSVLVTGTVSHTRLGLGITVLTGSARLRPRCCQWPSTPMMSPIMP